ncbi:MAG: hypothetical protein ACI8P0_006577, partial [Planctomycetaceae bacterium]
NAGTAQSLFQPTTHHESILGKLFVIRSLLRPDADVGLSKGIRSKTKSDGFIRRAFEH